MEQIDMDLVSALESRLDGLNTRIAELERDLALANDAAAKGDLARANAGGMEMRIKELEHENTSLGEVMTAANARIIELEKALTDLSACIQSHEIESLSCDRDDVHYCDCLRDMASQVKSLMVGSSNG